jgi:hypothetical protein
VFAALTSALAWHRRMCPADAGRASSQYGHGCGKCSVRLTVIDVIVCGTLAVPAYAGQQRH